jgi:hypothetical protein
MTQQRLKPESLMASSSYQYGSLPTSSDGTILLETHGLGPCDSSSSSMDNSIYRRRGRRPCTGIGSAVLAFGVLLWIAIHIVEQKGIEAGYFQDGNDDDDDDEYYHSSFSFAKLVPDIPLLGRSRFDPQEEANRNRDYLYFDEDDRRNSRRHRYSSVEDMLGSSHEIDTSGIHAEEGCEGTVLIMRHCEKGSIREHCNYLGYERSVYLATLFGDGAKWPAPAYILAEAPGARRNPEKMNFREVETVLPLSEKFNLTVDTTYSTIDTNKLARKVQGMMRSGEMCGKLVVVSWKHSKVPHLAQNLGCGPVDGCPVHYKKNDFDHIWQLKVCTHTSSLSCFGFPPQNC